MPATFSHSVMHHGKRHSFSVTAKDDSESAAREALEELFRQVSDFKAGSRPALKSTAYRKRK
jgi:hypothetical protein